MRLLGRRRVVIGFALICSIYGLACAYLYASMLQDPGAFGDVMAGVPAPAMMILPFKPMWLSARAGNLQVGDRAPDFELSTVLHGGAVHNSEAAQQSESVRLSDFLGVQPVVLVFGSYT